MKSNEVILVQQPIGLSVLITASLLATIGIVFFSAASLATGVLLFLLWLVSRILSKQHLAGIEIDRELPARATAGRSFPIKATIYNRSKYLPAREFAFTDPLAGAPRKNRLSVESGRQAQLSYTGLSKNRGLTPNSIWRLQSTWPLGFFETTASGGFMEEQQTLVRPRPHFPPQLRRHLEALREEASQAISIEHDPTAPFRMLREFRPGDSVRSIHWPGSLRGDDLLVRDLEPPSPEVKRFALLFHSYEPNGKLITPEAFELVLRIIAAVLGTLRNQEIELLFQTHPAEIMRIDSRAEFDEQLDRLAHLRRFPLTDLRSLETIIDQLPGCEETFVVSDCPIKHWRAATARSANRLTLFDCESLLTSSRPSLRIQRTPVKVT